jgi:hypothetical protein
LLLAQILLLQIIKKTASSKLKNKHVNQTVLKKRKIASHVPKRASRRHVKNNPS